MSKATQRDCILHRLSLGPATTWDLTVGLHILRPGARIFELRRAGYQIMSTEQMLSGKRVVSYSLATRKANGNAPNAVHERTLPIVVCTECGQATVRKPKTHPLRQGELPFCSDAHRAKYHREHKSAGAA